MTAEITQVSLAGVLAIMILREVLTHWNRRRNEPAATSQINIDSILGRLDRIIDRLDDMADVNRDTRKQIQITTEQTARLCRAMAVLEDSITKHRLAHDQTANKVPA